MGLFDFFKRKKEPEPPPAPVQLEAPGWDAITAAFQARYPGQTNPLHWAPPIYRRHILSENAPAFDGVSIYDAATFWHYVSYGLTELYAKENLGSELSGFGFELTVRVPKLGDAPPPWPLDMLKAIGQSV